jgi:hypothetical protein
MGEAGVVALEQRCGGEFDDAGVVDSVQEITGQHSRTFEQWAHDHT